MRMWGADPEHMCRQHLLGEHLEMHMFAATINNKGKIKGYVDNNLVDVKEIKSRHDAIAAEMSRRGYKHNTPMEKNPDIEYLPVEMRNKKLDKEKSAKDLYERCEECREKLSN